MTTFSVQVEDKKVDLKMGKITPQIRLASQAVYAKALSEALEAGYPLKAEIDHTLESKGLLKFEEHYKKSEELRKKLRQMEVQLKSAVKDGRKMTKEEGKQLAFEMRKIRDELGSVGSDLTNWYNNTVESFASNKQTQYLIYACTLKGDSAQTYWPSFDDFEQDSSDSKLEISTKIIYALNGISDDSPELKYYENKWLIKQKFVNDKLQPINAEGKLVDVDGRLIDENGRFIDTEGNFVDMYGNKIDTDGNLLAKDGWDE